MQQLESDLDVTQEKLMNANQRLEEKEKALQNAEGEVAALNICAKYSRTKPCQMKPAWSPLRTNLRTPESLPRRLTKNTMTLPRNCKWLSLILTVQKRGPILVRPRSLSLKRS